MFVSQSNKKYLCLLYFIRLVAEEPKSDDVKVDPPVNGLVNSLEVNTNHSESESNILPVHLKFVKIEALSTLYFQMP